MKRPVLLAALLFLWSPPRLEAEAKQCLPTLRCEKPRCEVLYELKMAKARLRALSMGFLGVLDETEEQESYRFDEAVSKEMSKAYRKYAKCPPSYF